MEKRIKALKQRKADLLTESEQLVSKAAAENRGLTDDEKQRDDAIHAELEDTNDQITRLERVKASQRALELSAAEQQAVSQAGGDTRLRFVNLADFARAVHAACRRGGQVDARLLGSAGTPGAAPTNYMENGGSAGEGYLVPPQYRQEIWDLVFGDDQISLLDLVDFEPTTSNVVEFAADESTPWGSVGVQAQWRSEASQMTATKVDTDGRGLKLHELYAFVLGTEELLQDAPRLNARLTRKSAQAIRYKASAALVNGTGAGQPLGWRASAAKVSQAKETAQAADTFVAANAAKMFARQLAIAQAVWLINQDVFPQLLTMTIGNQPIWTPPAAGFTQAPGGFLLGRPVRISEHCETLGDSGDVQLVAPGPGYYGLTKQQGVQFAESMHLFFDYGLQAFRWTFRIGGAPFMSAPVSPAKGATTRSHFVMLDARA